MYIYTHIYTSQGDNLVYEEGKQWSMESSLLIIYTGFFIEGSERFRMET